MNAEIQISGFKALRPISMKKDRSACFGIGLNSSVLIWMIAVINDLNLETISWIIQRQCRVQGQLGHFKWLGSNSDLHRDKRQIRVGDAVRLWTGLRTDTDHPYGGKD